jgi:hypothetical protein
MLIGLADAAFAQSDSVARGQHDIDQSHLGQLGRLCRGSPPNPDWRPCASSVFQST